MVLKPFLAALLSAAILCFSTWPALQRDRAQVGGRRTLAASHDAAHGRGAVFAGWR